jgi:hypothetical protein
MMNERDHQMATRDLLMASVADQDCIVTSPRARQLHQPKLNISVRPEEVTFGKKFAIRSIQNSFVTLGSFLVSAELPNTCANESDKQQQRQNVARYPFGFTNEAVHQLHASRQRRLTRRVPSPHFCRQYRLVSYRVRRA